MKYSSCVCNFNAVAVVVYIYIYGETASIARMRHLYIYTSTLQGEHTLRLSRPVRCGKRENFYNGIVLYIYTIAYCVHYYNIERTRAHFCINSASSPFSNELTQFLIYIRTLRNSQRSYSLSLIRALPSGARDLSASTSLSSSH